MLLHRRSLTSPSHAFTLVVVLAAALSACSADGPVAASGTTRAVGATGASHRTPPSPATRPIKLGKVVLDGNFADPSQQWPTRAASIAKPFVSGATPSLSVNDANFTVGLAGTGTVSLIPSFGATAPVDLVNVAVSTDVQPSAIGAGDGVGVVCRAISGHAYVFSVGPADQAARLSWSISSQGAPSRQLGAGTLPVPAGPSLRIEGDCVGGQRQSPVQLSLSLDGHVIGAATDTQVPGPYFGLAGLHVSSTRGATSASFSSFQVRAASAA
jgi:hypothetical protein